MSFLSVQALAAGYGGRQVLKGVSLKAEAGQLVGVLGANGSGKTTLLKAVCGILPHTGACTLDGLKLEGLPPRQLARRCSYIPQRSGIAIDLSALEVVLMGFNPRLGLLERPTPAMRAEARAALARVGLAGREEENYLHLSEGQKQLCILARTLVSGGSLLLLDEPESALDLRYRSRMLGLLQSWVRQGRRGALGGLHEPGPAPQRRAPPGVLGGGGGPGGGGPGPGPPGRAGRAAAAVYGAVSLCRCRGRTGRSQLVLLKEPDEPAG